MRLFNNIMKAVGVALVVTGHCVPEVGSFLQTWVPIVGAALTGWATVTTPGHFVTTKEG